MKKKRIFSKKFGSYWEIFRKQKKNIRVLPLIYIIFYFLRYFIDKKVYFLTLF